MEQLLNNYIELLVPQKKSSTSNSESNNTTELFTYSSLTGSLLFYQSIENSTNEFFLINRVR